MKIILSSVGLFIFNLFASSQDSLITLYAKENHTSFIGDSLQFSGKGWDSLINKINENDFILIGEDHFINEVPVFLKQVTKKIHFDNFFCEIDPFSAAIIQQKIKCLQDDPVKKFIEEYKNTFSFYSFKPDFELLIQLVNSKTNIIGTDQVLLVADRLLSGELKNRTSHPDARRIYRSIDSNSKFYYQAFLKDQSKPFYLLTREFEQQLNILSRLPLSSYEKRNIQAMRLSRKIYLENNHHLRIQLMKNEVVKNSEIWTKQKNLFRYGANHLAKGESFLKIYDIGNLVHNLADAQFSKSLHILVVGMSGFYASPFQGYQALPINVNEGFLKELQPFFKIVNNNDWYLIDLKKVLLMTEKNKVITSEKLSRILKGYDLLIIIPDVKPAPFL